MIEICFSNLDKSQRFLCKHFPKIFGAFLIYQATRATVKAELMKDGEDETEKQLVRMLHFNPENVVFNIKKY